MEFRRVLFRSVRNNPGNHDPHQAAMLSICLAARFHDNPRVTIDDSPSSFFYFRFGKTLIGSTHGDGAKLVDLPLIMARDVKEDWAELGRASCRERVCQYV